MKKALWISLGFAVALAFSGTPSSADEDSMLKKMNSIEEQQAKILQTLDEIKAEINIIKIRITSNQ